MVHKYTPAMGASPLLDILNRTSYHAVCDGSIEFRVRVAGLGEILWWILGYGDQVKVVSPGRLARQVASMARRTLARYEGRV